MDIEPNITPRQQYLINRITRRSEAYKSGRSVPVTSGFAWLTVFMLFALSLFILIPKPDALTSNNRINDHPAQEITESQYLDGYRNVIWHKKTANNPINDITKA